MDQPPALKLDGLRFRYGGSGPWIVDVGSFELEAGGQALLTAPSGYGKSTLLHLIAGLAEPNEGSIEVAGKPLASMRGASRDRFRGDQIGMIFQTFNLLVGFTARENVLMGLHFSSLPRGEHEDRASELLGRLGIERKDAAVEELSVGQQQRVAVARAVACKPKLILADEPTASLDPANAQTAIELMRSLAADEGAALLCTSHDPAMAELFDHRVAMESLTTGAAVAGGA